MENEGKELQVQVVGELPRLNVTEVRGRVNLISQVMKEVMQGPSDENPEGVHYGIIPGVKKPSLYQPGAQKLCILFKFDPEYEEVAVIEQPDLISYRIRCTLYHQETRIRVASGLGACNSREEKYRWTHKTDPVETEPGKYKPVPREYWEARTSGDSKEMKRLIGEGLRAGKIAGAWVVCYDTKVENDNPWDHQNTIYKMACKRAFIAATLNGTGASDIFTQDVEDMMGFGVSKEAPIKTEVQVEDTIPEEPKKDTSQMSEPEKEKAELLLFFESEMAPTPFKNLKTTLTGKVGVKESLLNQLIYLREKKAEWKK